MAAFQHRKQQTALVYDLLPPERAAKGRQAGSFERKADVDDAEFVIVKPERQQQFSPRTASDNRSRAQSRPQPSSVPVMDRAATGLNIVEATLQRASARMFAILVAALAVLVFGWVGGFSSLLAQPAVAPGALTFSHVTLTPRDANGMRVLVLNGIVDNETGADARLSPIRADFVSGDRLLASLVVAAPAERLSQGESRGFMARLPHPGGKMPEVRLSFMPSAASQP